ncbi:redoxin domain-containing protein [Aquincola sp. S2]|uniref:thioredoxin-dependent peroxiredoxin n=1 Tax=Pseudaquabacterium terrae TaxID=2732868 RepID=A0ABX2EPW3_9BURK|nr:redoxin domain-containing protein [Aquabacterium terrae]NRF70582.1 redoxin domain-containing protein [Aquabacterium terrae]
MPLSLRHTIARAAALLASLHALPAAHAALAEGDAAPTFSAPASLAGRTIDYRLADALSRGPVVVWFYPAAFTGGCSLQARGFAEAAAEFAAAGATLVGVSLDHIERLNAFSADPQSCAGKFPVASDSDGRIARRYALQLQAAQADQKNQRGEAIAHDRVERTTFVIRRDGRIAAAIGGVSPRDNVARTLAAVKALGR